MAPLQFKHARGSRTLLEYSLEQKRATFQDLIDTGILESQEQALLALYKAHPEGLTDGEASALLGWPRSTVSARRNGLNVRYLHYLDSRHEMSRRLITTMGERRQNPGARSKTALVWSINHGVC